MLNRYIYNSVKEQSINKLNILSELYLLRLLKINHKDFLLNASIKLYSVKHLKVLRLI